MTPLDPGPGRIEQYYGNNRAAKAIYGAILLFVFVAGMQHKGETGSASLALSTFVAALTIVLAEVFAESIGERIRSHSDLGAAKRREIISDAMAIASVSIWPSLIFLISGTHLYTLHMAFTLSLGYLLLVILGFCYMASRLSGLSHVRAMVWSAITLGIGVGIIWLKYHFGH